MASETIKPCLKGGKPDKGYVLCFVVRPSRKNGKRHVAEYHVSGGRKLGFLGSRCTPAYKRKDAASFPSKKAAEFSVLSCEAFVRKPTRSGPGKIYKKAEKMV